VNIICGACAASIRAIRLRVGLDVLQLYQLSTIIEYVLMHVSKEFILFLGYACHTVQNFDVVV
jgi:hypothetical protein